MVALVLIAAIVSGAVAAGVTLAVLRAQSRTNPQTVDLGSHVTISEDNAAIQVAAKALPAIVTVVTRESEPSRGFGSGFLITSDGYIATNVHVIANATALSVLLTGDAKRHDARLVDFDCETGLAVLKVDGVAGLPTLVLGDSAGLKLGQTVVAAAGPLEPRTIAKEVVSGLHRSASVVDPLDPSRVRTFSDTIQTSVPVVAGASGGPLLNAGGQVVGINLSTTSENQPASVALAAADVQPDIEQLVSGGQLTVPSLGIEAVTLDPSTAALQSLPVGSLVRSIRAGGPAEQASLKAGDVITQLDDIRIDSAHPLTQVLRANYKPAQRVSVTVFRQGGNTQVQATLAGEHPVCG